jgi:hypothetical protein
MLRHRAGDDDPAALANALTAISTMTDMVMDTGRCALRLARLAKTRLAMRVGDRFRLISN